MVDQGIVGTANEDWWQGYFTTNPVDDLKATLTREGIKILLIQLGYIIED